MPMAAWMARRAGISHWHFQRIFKALTNETLKTYIRSRRLAVGIAVSRRCDLLVAVAQGKDAASDVGTSAQKFLASAEMTRWMTSAMDGR